MSSDMRSWKSLASTASNRLKTYVVQKDPRPLASPGTGSDSKQTWKEWAGEKINSRRSPGTIGVEKIAVFPGWAARRYVSGRVKAEEPFEIDVYISGFASAHRPPDSATRSQRAFMRLAKRFAALPTLDDDEPESPAGPSRSTEELLKTVKLPARPEDMSDEFEVEALERQFRMMNAESPQSSRPPSPTSRPVTPPASASPITKISADLKKLHANLEARLQPFWSSVLPSRIIYLQLFPRPANGTRDQLSHGPIASTHITTSPDGSFQARFTITWEQMCQHPDALHIAFGDTNDEHELLAYMQLLAPPTLPNISPLPPPPPLVATTVRLPLTYSPVRVISDIDDTVKHSDVLGGTRTVFHNVFVRELSELVIPGMGDWYTRMFSQGARFHYISNGPFELLPVLDNFLHVAHLPPGSMKLRSYAGRTLFSGLLSAPAARKRANVKDVLDAFPHSRFILVGDTGEQDMELYAEFASHRPEQILAVFIRLADATQLDDPTGRNAPLEMQFKPPQPIYASYDSHKKRTNSSSSAYSYAPKTPTHGKSNTDYFGTTITTEPEPMSDPSTNYFSSTPTQTPFAQTPLASRTQTPSIASTSSSSSIVDKLQTRVWAARMIIPAQIPFRVFREPGECVEEAERVMRQARGTGTGEGMAK